MSPHLECWSQDWQWLNCKDIILPQVPYKRLILAPYSNHALKLNLSPIDSARETVLYYPHMNDKNHNANLTMDATIADSFPEGDQPNTR